MKRTRFFNLAAGLLGLVALFVMFFVGLTPHKLLAQYPCDDAHCWYPPQGACVPVNTEFWQEGCCLECKDNDGKAYWGYCGGTC